MSWKTALCVIWLICLMLPASTAMAASSGTGVTGTVPLVIYEVSAPEVGHFTATVSWKTNDNATSQVFYDTVSRQETSEYDYYTAEDQSLATLHSVGLTGLAAGITYYYRVMSAVPETDFVAVSEEHTFTTPTAYVLIISSTADGEVILPGEGVFTHRSGVVVELVAEPDWGYQFVNWTGDVETIADVNAAATTITMVGDYSIRADFREIAPVTINWLIIGGIIAGALILAGLVVGFVSRRKLIWLLSRGRRGA